VKCRRPLTPRARLIALLLMDVDGVLTDGRISLVGKEMEGKAFDVKDGVGLWLARRVGLRTGVISGRGGPGVARRAAELGMGEVHLGVVDKLQTYLRVARRLKLADAQICYVGDDVTDLPILARVGMPVAVADAHDEVLRRVPFVTRASGGRGAVREVVDAILRAQGKWRDVLSWFEPERTPGRRNRRTVGAEGPR